MAAPHPGPHGPPRVDPRELRPRRAWFWVGGALIPASLLLGAVLFVLMLTQALSLPEFEAHTQGSQSATFTVDPAEHPEQGWLLYASPSAVDHTACTLSGPGGHQHTFAYPTFNHQVEGPQGSWAVVGTVSLNEPGVYTLTCQAPDNVRFGLSYGGNTAGGILGSLLSALGSILLIPFLGVVGGALIIILTAVLRGRHRQRLLNESTPRPDPHQP